nr:probable histone-arginine methyltransferase 1.3 [Tanacetum cinerariifolium]
MLLMQAQENRVILDEEQLLFIAGGQANMFDDDVDEEPAPTVHTMFMENLSLADPIYDEAGPSYDLDILSKRVEEGGVSLEYLRDFHEKHDSWLVPFKSGNHGTLSIGNPPQIDSSLHPNIKDRVFYLEDNHMHSSIQNVLLYAQEVAKFFEYVKKKRKCLPKATASSTKYDAGLCEDGDEYISVEIANKQQNYYWVDLTALHGTIFHGYFSQVCSRSCRVFRVRKEKKEVPAKGWCKACLCCGSIKNGGLCLKAYCWESSYLGITKYGTLLVDERMLESYVIARDRFLVPNGKMFPSFGRIHMAPFSDEYISVEIANMTLFWQQQNYYWVDLTALHVTIFHGYFSQLLELIHGSYNDMYEELGRLGCKVEVLERCEWSRLTLEDQGVMWSFGD